MKKIMTVTGGISADELGRTLIHEHFLFGFCGFQGDMTLGAFNEKQSMDICISMIERAKKQGFHTFVDATSNECGRNPEFLKKLAERTGVKIICSTGFYHESASAYAYWNFRKNFTDIEKEIYEMMKTELCYGISNTGIRAGVIKVASGEEITPMERCFFSAAGKASKELDVPIITHTQNGKQGERQARLLIEAGADAKRIAIGHMCGNLDLEYHESVLSQGVFDAFDRFGLEGELFKTPSDEERVMLIATLIKRGWEKQILMSHDSVSVELGRSRRQLPSMQNAHIGNIGERVIPMLKSQGITDHQLDMIFIKNPSNFLG